MTKRELIEQVTETLNTEKIKCEEKDGAFIITDWNDPHSQWAGLKYALLDDGIDDCEVTELSGKTVAVMMANDGSIITITDRENA